MNQPGGKTDAKTTGSGQPDALDSQLLSDIQQPLSSIRGFAQVLRDNSEPRLRDHAAAILAQVERLEQLLAQHRARRQESALKPPTPLPFPSPALAAGAKPPTPVPFPSPALTSGAKPPTPVPFPSPALSAGAKPATPVPFPSPAAAVAGPSILVVDDEEVMRSLMVSLLEPEGYAIDLAESGDQALLMISKKRYDLIISDKNLPGSASGLEVARVAKARHLDTAVILITGYASLETAQEGLEIGLVDYIEKPFDDIAEVRRRVREVIEVERKRPLAAAAPAPNQERRLVVLVEDRAEDSAKISEAVLAAGGRPKVATTVVQALGIVSTEHAAGVILSLDLKEGSPTRESLRQLRACSDALVTVSERTSMEQTIVAIRMGATACLPRALASPQALAKEFARLFPLGPERR